MRKCAIAPFPPWPRRQRQTAYTKTALILVGDFLGGSYERSKLYDPAFTTEYRQGKSQ